MLVEYDLEGKKIDKVQMAIDLLRQLEPEDGYHVAFSGGKDSQCVAELCKMAGVKHRLVYSLTTVDPPELVRFIQKKYPEAWENRHIEYYPDTGEPVTMWNLIPRKKMPPTRIIRYCCEMLKENAGMGKVTVTGVRWAESARRKAKQGALTVFDASAEEKKQITNMGAEYRETTSGGIVLNYDNSANKDVVEMCYRRRKTLVNPIINWGDDDVWEFLNNVAKVPHCVLYDQGYTRLGCIGCPMNTHREDDFARYPAYYRNYMKAFDKMLRERERTGMTTNKWKTAQDVMDTWLEKTPKEKPLEGQITMDV